MRWRNDMRLRLVGLCLYSLIAPRVLAHGGGLDSYGCHHNRKQGEYHCHRGENAGKHYATQAEMLKELKSKSAR